MRSLLFIFVAVIAIPLLLEWSLAHFGLVVVVAVAWWIWSKWQRRSHA